MSREIIFRGKTKQGEWLYGYYMYNGKHLIVDTTKGALGFGKEVIPETIGQFTGLTDKNGKKIFEGDIVQGTIVSAWAKNLIKCEIIYYKDGFISAHRTKNGGFYAHKVKFAKDIEVIGNIHDNKELLGENK